MVNIVSNLTFLLWGISYGALAKIYQTAITRQVTEVNGVANSLQASTFNFGIVFGSSIGGLALERF